MQKDHLHIWRPTARHEWVNIRRWNSASTLRALYKLLESVTNSPRARRLARCGVIDAYAGQRNQNLPGLGFSHLTDMQSQSILNA